MTTTAVSQHTRQSQSDVTGVGTLLALAVRRDRVRLSVWIWVLTVMMVYAPNAVKLAYPDEAQRIARVNLLRTPAGIMMGGPFFGGTGDNLLGTCAPTLGGVGTRTALANWSTRISKLTP